MREIKFRGKCLDNGTWIYGSLFDRIWRNSADGSRVCYIFPDNMLDDDDGGGDSWEDFAESAEEYEVDPATVGQYTGLKAKNGKEIYEGDIVSVSYGYPGLDFSGVIEYERGGFILRYPDAGYLNTVDFCECDIHIIGNIHDNHELLATTYHEQ